MHIPKYEYCYQTYRYHYFNIKEPTNSIFDGNCYNAGTSPDKICEAIYDIEEKNPQELQFAWKYFLDNSISSEVPVINSPDDIEKSSAEGDYNPATGIATLTGSGDLQFVNVGVSAATYPLRNGYYRLKVLIEGIQGEVKLHHLSACDDYTTIKEVQPGRGMSVDFPFYYDSASSCPGNDGRFVFQLRSDTVNAQAKIVSIKLYEVNKI